jgi:hypothetical protein
MIDPDPYVNQFGMQKDPQIYRNQVNQRKCLYRETCYREVMSSNVHCLGYRLRYRLHNVLSVDLYIYAWLEVGQKKERRKEKPTYLA